MSIQNISNYFDIWLNSLILISLKYLDRISYINIFALYLIYFKLTMFKLLKKNQ